MPALWPVPLPLPTSFGGRDAYVDQLEGPADQQRSGAVPVSRPSSPNSPRRPPKRWRRARATGKRWPTSSRPTPSFRTRRPTTSPICNIRAARPASRTASRSPTARLLDNLHAHGVGLEVERHRPGHLLAALVSRHGPGRLPAVAGRQPDVGRLSEDRGFRPPSARLARPHHPQSRAPRSATRRPSATTFARAG